MSFTLALAFAAASVVPAPAAPPQVSQGRVTAVATAQVVILRPVRVRIVRDGADGWDVQDETPVYRQRIRRGDRVLIDFN